MNFIVTVKKYIIDPEDLIKKYVKDEQFIFNYTNGILSIKGSSWKKKCEIDDVANVLKSYFYGTNYELASVDKMLN